MKRLICVLMLIPTLGWTWELVLPKTETKVTKWLDGAHWEEQRGDADQWRIGPTGLRTSQHHNSTTIGTEKGFPQRANQSLEFSFRVLKTPVGSDLSRKNKEDSALRIFVLFDKGGGIFSPPNTLGYAFGNAEPAETVKTSQRFDNVKFIIVASGKADPSRWYDFKRNIAADYRRAFGKPAPAIKAIAIKSDANNLDGDASAEIRWLRLAPR